jgi:hypothetical protein
MVERLLRISNWKNSREMSNTSAIALLAVVAAALSGCGPQPVAGGTTGELHAGEQPLSDVQVTVHRAEGSNWVALGFGVANSHGAFELVNNEASEPLWLPSGEYRVTLESVGAPVKIPREYTAPETTPFQIKRVEEGEKLNLQIPAPLLAI